MAEKNNVCTEVMEEDLDSPDNICLIRFKLNREHIRLWSPPFTESNGEKGQVPMDIVLKFSHDLNISEIVILRIFERLRKHALAKLKSKEVFQSTGVATLNLHVSWINDLRQSRKKDISFETSLEETAGAICERIHSEINIKFSVTNAKMIYKGAILKKDKSLILQHVVNGSNIMVILMEEGDGNDCNKELDISNRVSETKKIAEALSKRSDAGSGKHDHYFLEINDQQGNKITLPEEERQSLSLAMTLHEKGKLLLKEKKFMESLLLFLEADNQFSNCRCELLQAVDNYALLCLDIVWCYFSLEKLDYLPDAEVRLKKSKECFQKSYGPNMERLTFVKGSDVNELVSYVRVHILEAICYYLRGNNSMASSCLDQAEEYMKRLHVDEDKFTQVVSMGFSTSEARLSLRACRGDVTLAIEYITRKRQENEARKERERKEKRKHRQAKRYGKTASGVNVDVECLKYLEDMGFEHHIALSAVKHTNNNINQALEILQNNPELILMSVQESVPEHLIQQFVDMGFPYSIVKKTLQKCNCDVDSCMNALIERSSYEASTSVETTNKFHTDSVTSDNDVTSDDDVTSDNDEQEENKEEEIDAKVFETLKDISQMEEEDYLDVTLEEEAELINKYRMLTAISNS